LYDRIARNANPAAVARSSAAAISVGARNITGTDS
jgi:hypothetical protein